jgi:hypothetical protein
MAINDEVSYNARMTSSSGRESQHRNLRALSLTGRQTGPHPQYGFQLSSVSEKQHRHALQSSTFLYIRSHLPLIYRIFPDKSFTAQPPNTS